MTTSHIDVRFVSTPTERKEWDGLASRSVVGHMHQCQWWAEPLSRCGVRTHVLGCWKDSRLVGGALFRSIPLPFIGTCYTECLDGPIFLEWDQAWAKPFARALREFAGAVNSMAVVLKSCSRQDVLKDIIMVLRNCRERIRLTPGDAEALLPLDGRSMNDIWKSFKDSAKSGVKKSQKRITSIRSLSTTTELSNAYAAWMATAGRKGFSDVRPWPFIEPVLTHSVENGLGFVLGCYDGDRLLGAIFVANVGQKANWIYSGYMDGCEWYNPTHLLVYEAIRASLDNGLASWSFGKLTSDLEPEQDGVDKFKLGFGALLVRQTDTLTIVYKPLIYRGSEWMKKGKTRMYLTEFLKRRLIRRATVDHGENK